MQREIKKKSEKTHKVDKKGRTNSIIAQKNRKIDKINKGGEQLQTLFNKIAKISDLSFSEQISNKQSFYFSDDDSMQKEKDQDEKFDIKIFDQAENDKLKLNSKYKQALKRNRPYVRTSPDLIDCLDKKAIDNNMLARKIKQSKTQQRQKLKKQIFEKSNENKIKLSEASQNRHNLQQNRQNSSRFFNYISEFITTLRANDQKMFVNTQTENSNEFDSSSNIQIIQMISNDSAQFYFYRTRQSVKHNFRTKQWIIQNCPHSLIQFLERNFLYPNSFHHDNLNKEKKILNQICGNTQKINAYIQTQITQEQFFSQFEVINTFQISQMIVRRTNYIQFQTLQDGKVKYRTRSWIITYYPLSLIQFLQQQVIYLKRQQKKVPQNLLKLGFH